MANFNLEPRPIYEIARDIKREWLNVSPQASPYLEAMLTLSKVTDRFVFDSANEIINKFLCNASSFRGAGAQALKNELKSLIK